MTVRNRWAQALIRADGLRQSLHSFAPEAPPDIQIPLDWEAWVIVLHGVVRVGDAIQPATGAVYVDEPGPLALAALIPESAPPNAGATILITMRRRPPCDPTEGDDESVADAV